MNPLQRLHALHRRLTEFATPNAEKSFIKLMKQPGWDHAGRGIFARSHGTVELKPGFENTWRLGYLGVRPEHRGQGHGSRMLKEITGAADKAGVAIHATVQPDKGGLNKRQLHSWYKRAGFVRQPYSMQPEKMSDNIVRAPRSA